MAKKKKEEEEVYQVCDDCENILDACTCEGGEDTGEPEGDGWDEPREPEYVDNGDITNSLQLANKTLEPSEQVKNLPEMLKETRIAFLTEAAGREVKHAAKNYDSLRYIIKILKLQKREDDALLENKKELYKIVTVDDLEKYLKSINRYYLFDIIKTSGELSTFLYEVQGLKQSGMAHDIQKISQDLTDHYKAYNIENAMHASIDDSGMIQRIATESVVSSGIDGNERKALISTVQVTSHMDISKETKLDEPSTPIIGGLKKAFNKFRS